MGDSYQRLDLSF